MRLRSQIITALSVATALAACDVEPDYTGRVIVDLNRTTIAQVGVRSVLSDSTRSFTLEPDENGVYSFVTDTLPDDLYVLSLDSAHVLPMVIKSGMGQKVCGTVREWANLSFSDKETQAVLRAEALRRRLAVAADSARNCLTMAEGRKLTADSLAKVRADFRKEADAMLAKLSDTSLASVPVLGMPGLYDDAKDNAMLMRRYGVLANAWPALTRLADRRDFLGKVKRLNDLRETYAMGKHISDFLFISNTGDTLSAAGLQGRRMALAFLPDSASTPKSVTSRLGLMGLDGMPVLIQAADTKVSVAGKNVRTGRFMSISRGADIDIFRPVVIVVAKDGTVERLSIETPRR